MDSFRSMALRNLLIEKSIITKEEYDAEYEKIARAEWDKRHEAPRSLEDQATHEK